MCLIFEPACVNGTYGANCSRQCSRRCAGPGKLCDNVKGWCLDGCIPGYKGNMCDDYDGRDDGGDNDDDRNNKDDDGNGGNEDDDCDDDDDNDDAVRRHV